MATRKKTVEVVEQAPENTEDVTVQEEPVQIDIIQAGTLQAKSKVSTGNCADYLVKFPRPFDPDTVPVVVVGFTSGSTAARFGTCACAVVDGTVTNEGFTIRFYNGDTSSRIPGFSYIAFGVVTQ